MRPGAFGVVLPRSERADGVGRVSDLEAYLAERDDRAWVQAQARAQLREAREPPNRLSVARRAHALATDLAVKSRVG